MFLCLELNRNLKNPKNHFDKDNKKTWAYCMLYEHWF